MASAQLDRLEKAAEKTGRKPRRALIISPPCKNGNRAAICAATGLLVRSPYWADRARDTFPFVSPLAALVTLRNLRAMASSADVEIRRSFSAMYPGVGVKSLKTMERRLLLNPETAPNFNNEVLETHAAKIEGRGMPLKKFMDALDVLLNDCPLVYRGPAVVFAPRTLSAEYGWSAPEFVAALAELMAKEKEFAATWGWHCDGLIRSADAVFNARLDRRRQKVYHVVYRGPDGNVLQSSYYTDLELAHKEMHKLMSIVMSYKAASPTATWRNVVFGNPNKMANGLPMETVHTADFGEGNVSISLFRDKFRLAKLLSSRKHELCAELTRQITGQRADKTEEDEPNVDSQFISDDEEEAGISTGTVNPDTAAGPEVAWEDSPKCQTTTARKRLREPPVDEILLELPPVSKRMAVYNMPPMPAPDVNLTQTPFSW